LNLAIALGSVSGLVGIDVDDPDQYSPLEKKIPEISGTARSKTPRGYHFYFNTDKNFPNTMTFLGLQDVELRSRGLYCVAPDSVVDGITYVWENPLDNALELPDHILPFLHEHDAPVSSVYPPFRSDGQKCIQQILNRDIEKGLRNDSLFCLYCLLLKKNKPSHAVRIIRTKNFNLARSLTENELFWVCSDVKESYNLFGCDAVRKRLPFVDCSGCKFFYRGFRMKENLILKHYKSIPDRSPVKVKILEIIELFFDGELPSITKLSRTAKIDWRIVDKAVKELKMEGIL